MRKIAVIAALTLAVPAAAAAQGQGQQEQHGQHMGPRHGMHGQAMMHGGMGMMMARPGPGMLLQLEGTLDLSGDQVAELEAMHAEAHEAMQSHHQAARQARERAHEAMMGEADLAAFEAALQEAARHDVQAALAMARVHVRAGEVLTDEQRATLHTVMQGMREMHRGMGEMMHGEGQGEMRHQGMQRRGMQQSGG